jgi:hypothetical protein
MVVVVVVVVGAFVGGVSEVFDVLVEEEDCWLVVVASSLTLRRSSVEGTSRW